MAWSIFDQGGGQGAAVTWADDLLGKLGAPRTPGNEQFVYDWEVSEGGGGAYNPLNQGPVPGHPELTTTGSQYGGGAADFAGWNAGLTGAVDYLNMPNYSQIKASLINNDPAGARSALIQSPWAASHYGDGSAFSDSPLPGKKSALPPDGGKSGNPSSGDSSTNILPGWLNDITSLFGFNINADAAAGKDFVERAGLIVFGFILLIVGIIVLFRGPEKAKLVISGQAKDAFGTPPWKIRGQEKSERQKEERQEKKETTTPGRHRKPKPSERPAKGKHASPSEKSETPGTTGKTGPIGEPRIADEMALAS